MNRFSKLSSSAAVSTCLIGALTTTPLLAQESAAELEEVIVSAQKRVQSATEVPVSVTAVQADQLTDSGLNSVGDLAQMVPGMRVDFSGGYAQPTIRGIGSAIAGTGFSTNVATYIDGFYLPSQLTTDALFLNLESVEVLKGPQGTLFGRNATGGAILTKLREPSFDPKMEVKASFARFNKRDLAMYGSAGVTETLALDFGAAYEGSDGFTDNIFSGKEGVDGYDNWVVRSALLWKPSDAMSFKLAVQHDDHEDGRPYATNVIVNPLTGGPAAVAGALGATVPTQRGKVANSADTFLESNTTGVYLTSTFDLDFAELTSYTQYRDEEVANHLDLDSSPLPIQQGVFYDTAKTFTQEFNLSGLAGGLDYVVGAYYIRERETQDPFLLTIGDLAQVFGDLNPREFYSAESDVKAWALFADTTYALTDRWSLIAGLRYSDEKSDVRYDLKDIGVLTQAIAGNTRSLENSGKPFDGSWSGVTPRAGIKYKINDDSNVYFTYSEGFKAGIATANQLEPNRIKQEEVSAYELGYKYGGSRVRLDTAVYFYDYQDLQIASYVNGSAIYQNAEAAEIYGAEVAITTLVTDQLQVTAGAAYTHAEYTDYEDAAAFELTSLGVSNIVLRPDINGFQMQRAPEWTANFGVQYTVPIAVGSILLSGNYYYTSKFPFDTAGEYFQDDYNLVNLRAAWTDAEERWQVAIFGTNVFDEEYNSQVLPGQPAIQRTYGEPAVVGVSVGFKY